MARTLLNSAILIQLYLEQPLVLALVELGKSLAPSDVRFLSENLKTNHVKLSDETQEIIFYYAIN